MKPLLKLLIKFYHLLINFRLILYQAGLLKTQRVNTKIISVGNISFGGTGKTPITIKIGENLKKNNYKIAILLRGYKRKSSKDTQIVFDGNKFSLNVEESGDEAYLIAKKLKCPVVVAKDRIEGAKLIIKEFSPDFIILDDGFQHLKLYRDKDIVLVAQRELFKNFFLFRESINNIKRADIVIITKIFDKTKLLKNLIFLRNYTKSPIFCAKFYINSLKNIISDEIYPLNFFQNKEVVLFCGIAYPEYLIKQLEFLNIKVKKLIKFPDHTFYTKKEYKILKKYKNFPLFTTEKDEVKLDKNKIKDLKIYSIILNIEIEDLFNFYFKNKET